MMVQLHYSFPSRIFLTIYGLCEWAYRLYHDCYLQPPLRAEGRKINARRRVPTTRGISSAELLRDILVAVWNPQRGVFRIRCLHRS